MSRLIKLTRERGDLEEGIAREREDARLLYLRRTEGARRVFMYGTHALLSDGVEKFKILDKVLVSDTLLPKKAENFEVVSLIPLFGEAVYRTIMGKSLSALFDS